MPIVVARAKLKNDRSDVEIVLVDIATAATGGEVKRITSGAWSLPISFAPAGPPSQLTWTEMASLLCS